VSGVEAMTDTEKLAELLIRWEEAWDHGEDIPASQLCADCPDLVTKLEGQIDALKKMAWMKQDATEDADGEAESPDPLISKTLGDRYRIDELIAEGGFGRVYRGFDPELQRPVAIKIPKAVRIASAEQENSLLEEARKAAKLRHAGIVAVHDVGREDGVCFIVTDLIDGTNLAEVIANKRPKPHDAARLVAQIAEHLHAAHDQGFIHRDIKPSNILIDAAGKPLIADFGIAATTEEVEQGEVVTSGTLPYMAPEQVAGEVQLIDARTDIHALGVVLYELLTGTLPYQARTPTVLREQILFRQPKAIRTINPVVPRELEQICLRCIAKHPADRFASAEVLSSELQSCTANRSNFRHRRLVLGILLAVAVVSSLAVGWRYLPRFERRSTVEGVFVFDGSNRILTPLERFAPVTLEAWVRPTEYDQGGSHFVVGSDIPSRGGSSLVVNTSVLMAEYVYGEALIPSDQVVPLNQWSHVAVVFAVDATRLYFNGRLIGTGPATKPLGVTNFVVGGPGIHNQRHNFKGQIRSVRISKGERYSDDFTPEEHFDRDADDAANKAVLIYDGSRTDGDRVFDLSGEGNDGTWDQLPDGR